MHCIVSTSSGNYMHARQKKGSSTYAHTQTTAFASCICTYCMCKLVLKADVIVLAETPQCFFKKKQKHNLTPNVKHAVR